MAALDTVKRLVERFDRNIDATDAEIDRLVYDLYSLTESEIRLVEKATQ